MLNIKKDRQIARTGLHLKWRGPVDKGDDKESYS